MPNFIKYLLHKIFIYFDLIGQCLKAFAIIFTQIVIILKHTDDWSAKTIS
jgi:hypothetical protein